MAQQKLFIAPATLLRGAPDIPSSKYHTLRYLLAATLADGESHIAFPAHSDDSAALFRGCRALGAELSWQDQQQHLLRVRGVQGGRPAANEPVTINAGNAGAVLRLLLGPAALLPQVTFVTDHPQSLGRRPNRELLEALTTLGARYEAADAEGCLPVTIYGGRLHGGRVEISGARSSQYVSSLLFLAPLLDEDLEIVVIDHLKSQPLIRASLAVLQEAGIIVNYDETLRHFFIAAGQRYRPCDYVVPGDYPSAAALLAVCAVATDPASELRLSRLRPGDEIGTALLDALRAMGADLHIDGDTVTLRGGRPLHSIQLDGDRLIDCIPVLVAVACFAQGESVFYNIESLHYKESDRINDLCTELVRAGCKVIPQRDSIIVEGQPEGVEGGVTVEGHNDHRLLMALATVALRSRHGLTLTGSEHIAKSYPHYFAELQRLGAVIKPADD
ncbi:MAG: 3-phosphoshikimate 1-carboxyvinyltransferase [Ktedonobacteraceae bacterium]|nr:3-phosphoshikimate 1-carboxyvinyltransferase [Ktedonobacteraceae bacterium]